MGHGDGTTVVRIDPGRITASADRFDGIASALGARAIGAPTVRSDAGFVTTEAAARFDADLVAAARGYADRARALGDGLRAAALAWQRADDAAAAALGR